MFRADGLVRGGFPHGFTSRVSPGSLSATRGESDEIIVGRWAQVLSTEGLSPESLVVLNQVHGACVVRVERGDGPLVAVADADAVITTRPGVPLSVRVADCVPLLLAVPGAVAAVHAGWRGTVAEIVPRAVEALCAAADAVPEQVVSAMGPCIGACCFEVGPEVVAGLGALLPAADFLREGRGERPHVDLWAANRALLERCGVQHIETVGPCTACSDELFSYRAEHGVTGRQVGFIALGASAQ